MKTITTFILLFTCYLGHSQYKQCFMSYSQIDKIFELNSHEDIDNELKKLGYTFNFNSTYTTYWNEKTKSNFNIHRDENTSEISFVHLDVNENCYNNLKKEIIAAGFIKVNEKLDRYRINFYYKKNAKYIILGKVSSFNVDGEVVKTGFDFTISTENKYNEFINGK